MKRLTIKHSDFTLTFACEGLDRVLNRARGNLREPAALQTSYHWTGEAACVTIDGSEISTNPFFFDNTDYAVWVDFNDGRTPDEKPIVQTMRADIQNGFDWHDNKAVLSGFLNYGNDIGKSDFSFDYTIHGERRRFSFGYEVLSSKLDYHSHFKTIVADIEAEYKMLSLDFLRRTYHAFAHDPSQPEHLDLIWWNLFKRWKGKFSKAARLILQKPRHRGNPKIRQVRADRLKFLTPVLENGIAEHRCDAARLYREEFWSPSNDTPENRFFKYALATVERRHAGIVKQIEEMDNVAETVKQEMAATSRELRMLRAHPFFRTVGEFRGLTQESLVLQRADGYAALARVFAILNASYALKDGLNTLETKDIATLYEIWCFITVKNIVEDKCKQAGGQVFAQNRGELSRRFVYSIDKGRNSVVRFRGADGTEVAELLYNATTAALDEREGYIVAPSGGEQRPDIVLRLTKPVANDSAFKLTYLFDAKYRLGEKDNRIDAPPDDAINQMHRYRDAIYYSEPVRQLLRKEVIGGYILFPGAGETTDVREARFYKSIETVNIGAFPLRPDDTDRRLLREFIENLLDVTTTGEDELKNVIPHKRMLLQLEHESAVRETTLFGTTHGKLQLEWIRKTGMYNLPEEDAKRQGIVSNENAVKKRWLALVPPPRSDEKIEIFKITQSLGQITAQDLTEKHGYYKTPNHVKYWLWKVEASGN